VQNTHDKKTGKREMGIVEKRRGNENGERKVVQKENGKVKYG